MTKEILIEDVDDEEKKDDEEENGEEGKDKGAETM